MTRPDAPTPPPPTDAEYVRKLALAILGTLQNKGLLSAAEVDSILIAARRAVQPQTPKAASGQGQPAPQQEAPAQAFREVTVQPSSPPGTLSWQVVPPPAQEGATQEAAALDSSAPDPAEQHPAGDTAPRERETPPPVIDFKLD